MTSPVEATEDPAVPHQDAQALCDRVRHAMRGRSLRAIGRSTGVSAETVRRYARGAVPSSLFLMRLCVAEKIDPAWLLLGEEHEAKPPDLQQQMARVESATLLNELARRMTRVLDQGLAAGEVEVKPNAAPSHSVDSESLCR